MSGAIAAAYLPHSLRDFQLAASSNAKRCRV
jgi:hypothetical protein